MPDNHPKTLHEAVAHFSDLQACHDCERWAPIPGWPSYQISTFGRVKSVARRVVAGHGWRDRPETIRSTKPDAAGYHTVVLAGPNGAAKRCYVHRLVLEVFVGPCPDGMEARHFPDRNPANNRLDNLSWASHDTNIQDRKTHGTSPDGEKNYNHRLTDADVRKIKIRLANGESQKSIAKDFPVGRTTIQGIKCGRLWSHVTV